VSFTASGDVVYTPDAEIVGTDQFTYQISDGSSTATGQVTVDIVAGSVTGQGTGDNSSGGSTGGLSGGGSGGSSGSGSSSAGSSSGGGSNSGSGSSVGDSGTSDSSSSGSVGDLSNGTGIESEAPSAPSIPEIPPAPTPAPGGSASHDDSDDLAGYAAHELLDRGNANEAAGLPAERASRAAWDAGALYVFRQAAQAAGSLPSLGSSAASLMGAEWDSAAGFSSSVALMWNQFDKASQAVLGDASVTTGTVAVAGITGALSVGYVLWMVRGGILVASVVSAMPAWQSFDPLPVLQYGAGGQDDDDESIESLVSSRSDD
jgi:hypothetical protein